MLLSGALHILCMGDSLTAGFSRGGALYHPYTIALKDSLETSFPNLNVSTDNQGVSGDQATSPPGNMLPRMEKCYREMHPEDPYDWAIVMAGTNDVSNFKPDVIFSSLQKLWNVPLSNGTKVLALTIPDCGWGPSPIHKQGAKLNKMILNHKAKNFYTYDLREAVPWEGMPDERRQEIWDDPVHFTAKGYDLIGTLLAERLKDIIQSRSDGRTAPGRPDL